MTRVAPFIPLSALMLAGCLDAPERLTKEQYDDIVGVDTRGAETDPGDSQDIGEVTDTAEPGSDVTDTVEPDVTDTVEPDTTTPDTVEPDTAVTDTAVTDTTDTTVTDTTVTDTTVTDTTVADTTETVAEVTDTDSGETVTSGCDDEADLVTDACLPEVLPLFVFEPEHTAGAMGPPLALTRANSPNGASTWQRTAEPVEVALENGHLSDPALLAYFPFDGTMSSTVGAGLAFAPGPPTKFNTTPGAIGQCFEVAPRYGVDLASSLGSKSFTIASWFWIDPTHTSVSFDLVGFSPNLQAALELALGIAGGQWSALVSGARTEFGKVTGGWQHVALSWDAPSAVGVLYLDGVVGAVIHPTLTLTSAHFFVGAMFPQGGHDLAKQPQADELLVLTRALAPSELRAYVAMHRPFGTRLMPEAQPDYDDLRVVRDHNIVATREVIGRRPHGDSGAEVDDVFGVWRFDHGSIVATYPVQGLASETGIGLEQVVGAFGDAAGAVRPTSPGKALIAAGRQFDWGPELTIELWVQVSPDETTACSSPAFDDGATLLTSQGGDASLTSGWTLRLCAGRLELRTSAAVVTGGSVVADGAWHHVLAAYGESAHTIVVDGVVDGFVESDEVPADQRLAISLLHRPPPPGDLDPPRLTNAAIDDLVLHQRALGAGYAGARARPVLPHVRFLVDAQAGTPSPPYELRAGNEDVTAPMVNACGSLVSSCTGYLAWWRFEDARLPVLFDASGGGSHLTANGNPQWTRGLDGGLALSFDGGQVLKREPAPELGGSTWNLEVGVRASTTASEQVIIEHPGTGDPPDDVSLNYSLRVLMGGAVLHVFKSQDSAHDERTPSGATLTTGTWSAIGGGFAAPALTVSLNGIIQSSSVTSSPTPAIEDVPIFIGQGGKLDAPQGFVGDLDAVRIMNRSLQAGELLKYPPLAWQPQPAGP